MKLRCLRALNLALRYKVRIAAFPAILELDYFRDIFLILKEYSFEEARQARHYCQTYS